jgi:prolyl 4-hydroxylase
MMRTQTRKQRKQIVPHGVEYISINESYPGIKKTNDYPPIYIIDDFLTHDECDTLIELSKDKLFVSEVVKDTKTASSLKVRQSNSAYFNYEDVPFLKEKGEQLLNRNSSTFEDAQVTKYVQDGFYKAHLDSFDPKTSEGKRALETGGQRVATVLIYLTSNTKGGGTYFPKLKKRFIPKKGRAVLFFPARADGTEEPLNLHRAEKVHGEKWVSQIWARERDVTSSK